MNHLQTEGMKLQLSATLNHDLIDECFATIFDFSSRQLLSTTSKLVVPQSHTASFYFLPKISR